jgi:RecA-family ATPase
MSLYLCKAIYIGQVKELSTRRKIQGILAEIEDPSIEFSEIVSKTRGLLDGSQTKTSLDLKIITPKDVRLYEETTPLVEPFIYRGTVNLFSGPSGKGKSIVTLSMAKSILTGCHTWGKFQVVTPGRVLLIDEETPKPFLKDRFEKMGIGENLPLYILHFQGIQIDRSNYVESLLEKIREIKPTFIIFDSLIRFHSQNENEAGPMSKVMGAFRKIANEGVTVWIIHHHRKGDGPLDQKARGSSDIIGGVDTEFSITEKNGILNFSSVKTRVESFGPIHLKLEINDEEIKVVYQGTEEEELYVEIKEILGDQERLTVSEILEALSERKIETGIYKLRKVLKEANQQGITAQKEKHGKTYRTVYSLKESTINDDALRFPPIGGESSISVHSTLNGDDENIDHVNKALIPDNQHFPDAFDTKKEGDQKRDKRSINAFEGGTENEVGAKSVKKGSREALEEADDSIRQPGEEG